MCVGHQEAAEYYQRTGLGPIPQVLMNGVPMKPSDIEGDEFEEAVVTAILKYTPELQKAVYNVSPTSLPYFVDELYECHF